MNILKHVIGRMKSDLRVEVGQPTYNHLSCIGGRVDFNLKMSGTGRPGAAGGGKIRTKRRRNKS